VEAEEQAPQAFPVPLTSLIGRDQELALGKELLRDSETRLLTITGPPGVGKTRLALELAGECQHEFGDGGVFVALAAVSDTQLLASTIARAIGIQEAAQVDVLDRLEAWLRNKELLLLLDNFEQLVDGAPVVADLVAAAPALKALVTSRTRLRLVPEREFPLGPLGVPAARSEFEPSALGRFPATALFCDRAGAVIPGFAPRDAQARAVADICSRLDGLPLAIELAAARLKVLTPEAMRERLEHRLDVLTGGPRDLPARQRTLRDTIEWSHELLDEREQRLFRRLAVFVGGCTLEAAEALSAAAGDSGQILDLIAALVDQSLVRRSPPAGAEARLTMLETIREYGLERLASSGEEQAVRAAHGDYYLALAESAEPALMSAESEEWLVRLEREHDNLRAALRFLLDEPTGGEQALQLAGALSRFWVQRGHLSEGRRWCDEALACRDAPPATRAKALLGAALIAHDQVRFPESIALFEQTVDVARSIGDSGGAAAALAGMAFVIAKQGDFARADRIYEQALALAREAGKPWLVAHVGERRGTVLWMAGEYESAAPSFEESLEIFSDLGDRRESAFLRASLGVVGVACGQLSEGSALIEEALPALRESRSPRYLAQALLYAGEARLARRNLGGARAAYAEVLELLRPPGFVYGIMMAVSGLARVAAAEGRPGQSAKMFGAADAMAERTGGVAPALMRRAHTQAEANVRAALDRERFDAALSSGRRLTLDEAMDEAALLAAGPAARGEMTAREIEILRLVADQLTNKDIADRLFVSVRTVHAHLRSIFRKLGVTSRAAAGRRAAELDLL
jgi:predicted ATPase/DNA-binding CsgD family transcriptional regulator